MDSVFQRVVTHSAIRGRGRFIFLIFIFLLLSTIGVSRHELSLDEARPWIIVNETPALSLVSETRCEMHCLPWFYSLKALSGVFSNPVAMQVFGILLGTIAFGLIAVFSPFTLLEKSLLLVNYYTFFEFNLIARPYTLMTVGLFLVCATFTHRGSHPGRFLGSLLFLTHSTFFGIFLTFPFTGLYFYELLSGKFRADRRSLTVILVLAGIYLMSIFWYSLPLSSSYRCVDLTMTNLSVDFTRFAETTWDVTRAFFIIGNGTWNEHVFDYNEPLKTALSLFWIVSMIGILLGLRKNPRAAFLFGAAVFLLFTYRLTKPVYYGSFLRHLGALSLMYIGCMWIFLRENPTRTLVAKFFFHVFLICGAYSGLRLFTEDLSRPFSNGISVHRFISEPENLQKKIIADPILFTSSYLVYSDRRYVDYINGQVNGSRYYPISETVKPVYVEAAHIRGRHIVPKIREDIFRQAIGAKLSESPLVIVNYPPRPGLMEGMGLKELKSFNGAINPNEDYHIYTKAE